MPNQTYKQFKNRFLPLINEMSVMSSTDIHLTMGGGQSGSDYNTTVLYLAMLEREGKVQSEMYKDYSFDYFFIRSATSEGGH